ncbi:MAG: hypothetical protein HC899_29605 [Leptolyngbyaceae cyanobacterium SM1_4_3]|nr:hypothetical protein [Leptolyngbyaceae cyanobacterium SM1_4_3]
MPFAPLSIQALPIAISAPIQESKMVETTHLQNCTNKIWWLGVTIQPPS